MSSETPGEGSTLSAPSEEYPTALAARVASRFGISAPIEAFDFTEKGNINRDTFLVHAGHGHALEYILQRINHEVFTRPDTVMTAMLAALSAQSESLRDGQLAPGREWEPITLVPTRDGAPYLRLTDRCGTSFWRLMVRISDCESFKSLSDVGGRSRQLAIAEEAGRGLATYADCTAKIDIDCLENPLPGYRNTRLYYGQLHSVLDGDRTLEDAATRLPKDPVVREATKHHFLVQLPQAEYERRRANEGVAECIELAKHHEDLGTRLQAAMESGEIRRVAIHGDTKLENFLFSRSTGQAKALVDLDTIMVHTWLSDWGDMVRSLSNPAGERGSDLDQVQVDMEIYEAVARGFLATARQITSAEVAFMVDAVQVIALELGVRFLADYLRGDTYFRLGPADPPDLNRIRALVQLTLFERLLQNAQASRDCIDRLYTERGE